jgi:hypothetical protein
MGSMALLCVLAGCASGGPHQFGQYADLAPKVASRAGERSPQHLTVQVGRPANVAVFLVVPGRGSTLLFPADSIQSGFVEAGSHLVETTLGRNRLSDTSKLIRRPAPQQGSNGSRSANGRFGRDSLGGYGPSQHGYLLIFASQSAMPYSVLSTRVSGISIPIEDGDALNTVTKLIRQSTKQQGPWAAFATDFPP